MMRIRSATDDDVEEIRDVHLSAFPEGEGELVAGLAGNLMTEEVVPPVVSFVAELGELVAGHVVFSPVVVGDKEDLLVYLLAPLAVSPDYQKNGIGSQLIENGMERLAELGADVILVYGDPEYYGKFGFSEAAARNFKPPNALKYPSGWQACVVRDGGVPEAPTVISCVNSLNDPALW